MFSDITTLLLLLMLIFVSVAFVLMFVFFRKKNHRDFAITTETVIEHIRYVGVMTVLSARIKEVGQATLPSSSIFGNEGKILVLCDFDVDYKYNLKDINIYQAGKDSLEIILPPIYFEVILKKQQFYDERNATWVFDFFKQSISVEERNRLIATAHQNAIDQAKLLQDELMSKAQMSARVSITALANAFSAKKVNISFAKGKSMVEAITEQAKKLSKY